MIVRDNLIAEQLKMLKELKFGSESIRKHQKKLKTEGSDCQEPRFIAKIAILPFCQLAGAQDKGN